MYGLFFCGEDGGDEVVRRLRDLVAVAVQARGHLETKKNILFLPESPVRIDYIQLRHYEIKSIFAS